MRAARGEGLEQQRLEIVRLGFNEYNGGLKINYTLLSVVLHD